MKQRTEKILEYFFKICKIPRPSGHEKQIQIYLREWAESRKYKVKNDITGNLIITCPARQGFEKKPCVILQAHMDMVCIADYEGYVPAKDEIIPVFDGDYLRAKGTSLGADDGIGIALAQYLADEVHKRGELKLIFTVDEEETTAGACQLDPTELNSKYLINLDSEICDKVIVSSAGCIELEGKFTDKPHPAQEDTGVIITIRGLRGGHSGDDIAKERINANILLADIVNRLHDMNISMEFAAVQGGTASNAIPPKCVIKANVSQWDLLCSALQKIESEYKSTVQEEQNLEMKAIKTKPFEDVFSLECLWTFLHTCPNGAIKMSDEIEDFVELSSNIGVLHFEDGSGSFKILIRAEKESELILLARHMEELAHENGIQIEQSEITPSWPADLHSTLLEKAQQAYKMVTGSDLEPIAIHAVLECAEFYKKNEKLQMISISPEVLDVHSAQEKLYIPSVERCSEVLENLLSILS